MADTTVASAGRAQTLTTALPFLAAAVIYVVVLAVGGQLLGDADSYWHLVVGNWILSHGFPTTDPFSFTFAGEPWIAKEWLSQLTFAAAHAVGGWTLVVVVSAAAIALAFGLLARFLMDELAPMPVIACVAAAFLLAAPHMVARPHVLAFPVMVAWVGTLVRAVDRGRAPPWPLLALMVLWANLHAGFTLGILMVGALGLDSIVTADPAERFGVARRWVLFGIGALLAGMVTPYGPQSMLVTWRVLSLGPALGIIAEWQPPDFSEVTGFELVLLLSAGLVLLRGLTLPPVRILIVLGLVHMALSAVRNGEVLGLLGPLLIAAPIARQAPTLRREPLAARANLPAIGLILLAILAPITFGLMSLNPVAPAAHITPAAAVAALKQSESSRVFNDYDFGGYLIYSGIKPFIDGRTELYGGAFTARHHNAVTLSDVSDFLAMLDEYDIDATMLTPVTPAVQLLDRLPEWRRIYADDTAVVHVRTAR